MAKKQPSLLEALQALGLGGQQEGPAPKRIKDVPPDPPEPTPPVYGPQDPDRIRAALGQILSEPTPNMPPQTSLAQGPDFLNPRGYRGGSLDVDPHADLPYGHEPGLKGLAKDFIEGNLALVKGAGKELVNRVGSVVYPESIRIPEPIQPIGPEPKAPQKLAPKGKPTTEESLGKFGGARPPLDRYTPEPPATPNPNMAGVREQDVESRYKPQENQDNLGRSIEPVDLGGIIQQGVNEPPVEAVKTLGEPQRGMSLDDIELQALAKRAGEYKKPGVLEAIAVLANSLNPRQTPQGSMQFANQLRGEPERLSAERMLSKLTEARGRRQAEEAKQGGQYAIEGMKQGGALERAKIGAGARLGAAQINQQGLLKRGEMQGQTARDVASIRANAPASVSPGQRIQAANFHALGGINAEIGNVRKQAEAARMSLDPAVRASIPQLDAKLRELDTLKRNAIGILESAGVFTPEEAAMYGLGEGIESPDMDPEFLDALRTYRDQLNKALQR